MERIATPLALSYNISVRLINSSNDILIYLGVAMIVSINRSADPTAS